MFTFANFVPSNGLFANLELFPTPPLSTLPPSRFALRHALIITPTTFAKPGLGAGGFSCNEKQGFHLDVRVKVESDPWLKL